MDKDFFVVSKATADVLYWLQPLVLFAFGLLHIEPLTWFRCCLACFVVLESSVLVMSLGFDTLALYAYNGSRIQTQKKRSPLYVQEILSCTMTLMTFSQLMAWPLARQAMGRPTAFVDNFRDSMPLGNSLLFIIKMCLFVLLADTWTYMKHRALHHRSIYAFHKIHHTFHDPTAFAAFALHPVEALITFCPVLLFSVDGLGIYAPFHLPFLGFWGMLNMYLHCGVYVECVEQLLPKLFINTSAFHNIHHEKTVTHFGEMLFFWDYLLGTDTMRRRNLRSLFNAQPMFPIGRLCKVSEE